MNWTSFVTVLFCRCKIFKLQFLICCVSCVVPWWEKIIFARMDSVYFIRSYFYLCDVVMFTVSLSQLSLQVPGLSVLP